MSIGIIAGLVCLYISMDINDECNYHNIAYIYVGYTMFQIRGIFISFGFDGVTKVSYEEHRNVIMMTTEI